MSQSNVEQIEDWVNQDDVFIVDRGFRDSLALLEDLVIKSEMPAFMKKGDRQMPTEDANSSRLETKVRTDTHEAVNDQIHSHLKLNEISCEQ